jgi:GT2 family glycosyltransferase
LGPILHVPHVLYHWRIFPGGGSFSQTSRPDIDSARARLVGERLEQAGEQVELALGPRGHLILKRSLPEPAPTVTAIVPTRDHPDLLEACAAGLLEQTGYPGLELCIVDNGSRTERALRLLDRLARTPRVRVLRIDAPFNFSALNNAAATAAKSRLLAFINDDILVAEAGWLTPMAALAVRPDVGAVGAKLFYPDGRIQHAGIVLGLGPHHIAGHEFRGAPGESPGPQNRLLLTREVSAVTAACMVVERDKFRAVGGFDSEALPVAFNDVDLCLKLAAKGWRSLWTPQARLMHLESASRGSDKAAEAATRLDREAAHMRERWGDRLTRDPYYNPNLTLEDESFTLAAKSRAGAPWRRPG